jgi:hypothetical protein
MYFSGISLPFKKLARNMPFLALISPGRFCDEKPELISSDDQFSIVLLLSF